MPGNDFAIVIPVFSAIGHGHELAFRCSRQATVISKTSIAAEVQMG